MHARHNRIEDEDPLPLESVTTKNAAAQTDIKSNMTPRGSIASLPIYLGDNDENLLRNGNKITHGAMGTLQWPLKDCNLENVV